MHIDWQETLQKSDARVEAGAVRDFGDPSGELRAAQGSSVIADLSHLTALGISGEDAGSFLQGQLSCDVNAIPEGGASLGSYCTPKGRMLASFMLLRTQNEFVMLLSTTLAAAIQKRLSMFVLRAKVKIKHHGDELVLLGLSGPAVLDDAFAADVRGFNLEIPPFDLVGSRKLLLVPLQSAAKIWSALVTRFKPIGSGAWQWLDIRHGIPLITSATQDQLVPQMANLELIGGVSFKKGCYPGQEIVARTQYLGKIKRRMFRAHLDVEAAPGDSLYSDDLGDQASGLVVNAQPAPEGGYDLLAVAQLASRESSTVRLRSPQGPELRFEPLPYDVQ
jgi:folate-binding protein YgfZ